MIEKVDKTNFKIYWPTYKEKNSIFCYYKKVNMKRSAKIKKKKFESEVGEGQKRLASMIFLATIQQRAKMLQASKLIRATK